MKVVYLLITITTLIGLFMFDSVNKIGAYMDIYYAGSDSLLIARTLYAPQNRIMAPHEVKRKKSK